jgi:hypothetical protein
MRELSVFSRSLLHLTESQGSERLSEWIPNYLCWLMERGAS